MLTPAFTSADVAHPAHPPAGQGSAICSSDSFFAAVSSHFEPDVSSGPSGAGLVVTTGADAFTTVANSTIIVDADRCVAVKQD